MFHLNVTRNIIRNIMKGSQRRSQNPCKYLRWRTSKVSVFGVCGGLGHVSGFSRSRARGLRNMYSRHFLRYYKILQNGAKKPREIHPVDILSGRLGWSRLKNQSDC